MGDHSSVGSVRIEQTHQKSKSKNERHNRSSQDTPAEDAFCFAVGILFLRVNLLDSHATIS